MTTTSFARNAALTGSYKASAWAADVRAYDPNAVTPITLDRRLRELCGGSTADYLTARAFVYQDDPDYQTAITRFQIRIDLIKEQNKRRGHARARQIARARAGMVEDLPY